MDRWSMCEVWGGGGRERDVALFKFGRRPCFVCRRASAQTVQPAGSLVSYVDCVKSLVCAKRQVYTLVQD